MAVRLEGGLSRGEPACDEGEEPADPGRRARACGRGWAARLAGDAPAILAGDFNVDTARSVTIDQLDGYTKAGPGIDHVVARGASTGPYDRWTPQRRRLGQLALSDHAPSRWRSRDVRGGPRRLSRAREVRVPECGLGRATRAAHARSAGSSRARRASPREGGLAVFRADAGSARPPARGPRRGDRGRGRADVADDLDDGGVPDRARRTGARPGRRSRHDRRRALRAARPAARVGSTGSRRRSPEQARGDALETILAEVGPRTKLVALSHVLWINGHVLPMDELRAAVSAPILVDGAQSVGAIPVEAAPFDFYTVSGQKWLCGTGAERGLYVKDPERLAVSLPSYFSQAALRARRPLRAARRSAALRPRLDSGPVPRSAARRTRRASRVAVRALAADRGALPGALLELGCDVVTEPGHSNLVSWRWDGDTQAVALTLGEQGVLIRDLPGTGLLRASCGYWTSEKDLTRLVESLAGFSR